MSPPEHTFMPLPVYTYLGDSVYVSCVNGMLRLTTENGYGPTNEIFLEPEVYAALERFVERVWGEAAP